MPQIKKSENWDGVTAPALPPGWHADPGFQTSNAQARSGVNSLRFFQPGSAGYIYWTGTTDNFNGNARLTADFLFTGVHTEASWELLLRYDPNAQNAYVLNLEPPGSVLDGITLYKLVNGALTPIALAVGAGQLAVNAWYTAQLVVFKTSIVAYVQRVSDGSWYNGLSGWQPSRVAATQATDGTITGPGYAGLQSGQDATENNPLYSDNFLFEDLAPDTGILLKKRRRPAVAVPVQKPRRRGWEWFDPVLQPPPPSNAQWYQASTASPCGYTRECQANPPDPHGAVCLIRLNVQGGPVVYLPTTAGRTGLYCVSEPAAQAPWPPGPWTARLHVLNYGGTTLTWDALYICRVNTACQNQSTIAGSAGQGLDVSAPGTYHITLFGAADANAQATDCFYLAYELLVGGGGTPVGIVLDAAIDVPFFYFTPIQTFRRVQNFRKSSMALRPGPLRPRAGLLRRHYRLLANLLTPQPPATGPFPTALFRRRRPRVSPSVRKDNTPFPRSGSFWRKANYEQVLNLSLPPNLPKALFPRPRKRRPPRPVPRYRRSARWLPLAPVFVGADKAMIARAQVEENLQAAGLTLESLPGTALVVETMSGSAAIILGDVLRPLPVSVR